MILVGMHFTTAADGTRRTTLHVEDDFAPYYKDSSDGRGCSGKSVQTIYVGNYDCRALNIGCTIDISYDRAITTKHGSYQPIKKIEIIE